jgi:glycine cleavage system H protein
VEIAGCPLPEDRLYDLEHEVWWKADPDGRTAVLGVLGTFSAFAGIFRAVEFRPRTTTIGRGRSLATVESIRLTGAVRAPLDAEVVALNDAVAARPRLLNDRPYSDGWIARMRPLRESEPAERLERAAAVAARLEAQIRERRVRCWPTTPDVELNEVGLECSAILVKLNEEIARREVGEAVLLVTDDPTSPIEMVRWSDQTGQPVLTHRREGELNQFLIQKLAAPVPRRRA